jgi:uncharacterized protein YdaU (DUF1376 family)
MHYYNFNIGDYMKHTLHLTPEEDLAYRRLLDMYYDSESPIPNNIPLVSRRLRMDAEIVESVLKEFFDLTDEGYRNYRADGEIADYHKYLAKQQANGKLGGRPKKSQRKPTDNPSLTQAEPKKSLNNKQQTTNNNQINTPEGVSDSLFKDFLEVRKGKKAKWTETALKGLQREAVKANMTLEQVMQICCERGWAGFKAEWAETAKAQAKAKTELPLGTDQQIEHAYKVECNGDPSKANFRSYQDMRKFIQEFRDKSKRALQ